MSSSSIEVSRAAEALVRYRGDFRAFASEQLKIGGQPLRLWPCQMPLLEVVERQLEQQGFVRTVWLKSRQVGASTFAQALVAWRTMLWPNVNAIVIADEAERSRTLFDICRNFYEQLDAEVRPVGRYISKRELYFANPSQVTRFSDPGLRSRVVVDSAYKKNLAIGSRWDFAHLSEAARFKDPSFVIDGVIPAVHRVPGTFVILESSAEMAGHWYRDFCNMAMKGQNAFEFVFVPWFLQPEYYLCGVCRQDGMRCVSSSHRELMAESKAMRKLNLSADERHIMAEFGLSPGHILWMRAKLLEMSNDWDLFRQSYPLTPDDAWVTPGVQVFPMKHLREQQEHILPPKRHAEVFPGPRIVDAPQGRLRIWDEPEAGKTYDIGVDVSLGIGKDDNPDMEDETHDFSVACVLERGSNKQVAEWISRTVDSHELAITLYWLGLYYNTAQMAVETNGIGGATSSQLGKMGYLNLYAWRYRDELSPRYSKKVGWETSPRSKPWLVSFAVHQVMNNRVVIRSETLYKEMQNYVRKGEREWGAVAGRHDDAVTAWMIALLTSDDENFSRYFGLRKVLQESQETGEMITSKIPEPWEADLGFLKRSRVSLVDPWE